MYFNSVLNLGGLQKFITDRKWLFIYLLLGAVVAYFIFAPAINLLFYAGDDFRYTFGHPSASCSADEGFYFMMTLGRPLQAYVDCISFRHAYTLAGMRIVRMIAILLIGFSIGLIADWLHKTKVPFLQSFLIAAALILLPHFYADTIFMGALSLPVAIILTVIGYRCVLRSYQYELFPVSRTKKIAFRFLAVFALIFALLSYPAMVFFYPALMMTKLLLSKMGNWEKTRKEIICETIIFFLACCVFFAWAYYNMHYAARAPIPPQYRLDKPNFNILEMIRRFWIVVNIKGNTWTVLPLSGAFTQGKMIATLLAGGIMAGAVSFFTSQFYAQNKKAAFIQLLQMLVFAGALIGLGCSFSLIIPNIDLGARLMEGTVALGVILVIWSLFRISVILQNPLRNSLLTLVLAGYIFSQGYQANIYTMRNAMAYAQYLYQTELLIANHLNTNKKLARIHFIVEKPEVPYTRFFLVNGALTQVLGQTKIAWCAASRDGSKPEAAHQEEMLECLKGLPKDVIGITYSFEGSNYKKTDSMLTIDGAFDKVDITKMITL